MRAFLALTAAFLMGAVVTSLPVTRTAFSQSEGEGPSLDDLQTIMKQVQGSYVEDVSRQQLIRSAIDGMVSDLDPHSGYLDPEQFKSMQVNTQGEYGGLGLRVTEQEDGFIEVIAPIEGTPAAASDIRAGDLIVGVDGTPAQQLDLSEAVKKMRGEPGSEITITLRRDGQEPFDVTLERENVTIEPVRTQAFDQIGYLRITRFNEQAGEAVSGAITELREDKIDGEMRGLVIDLRNNPGGLLEQAIKVSDVFLDDKEVVSARGRGGNVSKSYATQAGRQVGDIPIVVLINAGSASASEIVAGALRDHDRAIVMGTRSFGKGSIQTVRPLETGGALRLTTARYYTPSGESIQAQGIAPDIQVAQAEITRKEASRSLRERDLRGALDRDDSGRQQPDPAEADGDQTDGDQADGDQADGDQAEGEEADGETDRLAQDYQLNRAVTLLRGVALMDRKEG
jgi:carboxyl-terminal processing protease